MDELESRLSKILGELTVLHKERVLWELETFSNLAIKKAVSFYVSGQLYNAIDSLSSAMDSIPLVEDFIKREKNINE